MLKDLENTKLIHLKGWLFLLIGILTALLLVLDNYKIALLLFICIWSFCRFYYYAFYVIEKYIDSQFKYSGLLSFLLYFLHKKTK